MFHSILRFGESCVAGVDEMSLDYQWTTDYLIYTLYLAAND